MKLEESKYSPVIVTGMHRSGTSLVAGFLHHSGIDMGKENLCGAGKGNVKGHFESVPFLRFHKGILHRKGFSDNGLHCEAVITPDDVDLAGKMIHQRINEAAGGPWGWKDPRTAFFLSFWDGLLPNARYIFMVRNPFAVADSLHRRDDAPQEYWWRSATVRFRFWCNYTKPCLAFAKEHPDRAKVIVLEDLLDETDSFAHQLSVFLQYHLEGAQFRACFDPALLKRKISYSFVMPREWFESMSIYAMARRMMQLGASA